MEIRETSFSFPALRGTGPQRGTQVVVFPRPVIRAVAALTGYSLGFDSEDHHVGILEARLETAINSNVVQVDASLGVRDWSGFWDDDYAGTITAAVLAEIEDVTAPPPRGDLLITGVEATQAIQSFRSAQHLDAANVLPDNAIPLVGGKTTGLRGWVDYDADAGLPAIAQLSGELVGRTGGVTTALAPLSTIAPRRDTEIERGEGGHTLNFRIPGALCRGSVEIELRVFDSASPAQRSAAFRRTLRFVDVNPLRVYGVGIHYLGQGLDLAAPDATDMLNTLGYTARTFPTGDVLLSGFTTIDFDEDLFTTDTSGCGDGFESLRGQLGDMRGDSDDLFYGLLPNGITYGTFVGCGGSGVGTGMVGAQQTAAHEAGHALGRHHAPCDSATRCNNPSNQDDQYPHYGSFPSDSIGEYGYDPLNDLVFDPANSFDFMGYSGSSWVSPYTYRGLFTRMDPPGGTGEGVGERAAHGRLARFPDDRAPAEWQRIKSPRLMLHLDVERDRTVVLRPSFTFPAAPRAETHDPACFTVEIRAKDGEVLQCEPLTAGCMTCRGDCWPRHLSGELPIDPDEAATLVIYECGKQIHEARIGPKPKLKCGKPRYEKDGDAVLRWEAAPGDAKGAIWYLVHWEDEEGVWRGLGPRSTTPSITVPSRLRRGRAGLRVRILATDRLATASCEVELKGIREDPPVTVLTAPTGDRVVRAWAVDHLGRTLANPGFAWYDATGRELVRGAELDIKDLAGGQQLIRVVAINAGAGKAAEEITVDPSAPFESIT